MSLLQIAKIPEKFKTTSLCLQVKGIHSLPLYWPQRTYTILAWHDTEKSVTYWKSGGKKVQSEFNYTLGCFFMYITKSGTGSRWWWGMRVEMGRGGGV